MNIAICDDEKVIREQLKELITELIPDSEIYAFESGRILLSQWQDFDILFLDIQMDGMDGMEVARTLRGKGKETVLIFVTGIKEHVFDAFDVEAFHYLLKPIEEEKFEIVLNRAIEETQKRAVRDNGRLFIKTKQRNVTIAFEDILYIESQLRKAIIHTVKERVEMYASMKELEIRLDSRFFRCHRGYLVNMAHIQEYYAEGITLSNGECIYLSREKYGQFVKTYMRYLQKGGAACV